VADADTNWKVYRPEWYNDRILETYISSPIIDKQNDKIGTDTIKESMDFYMKYGVYSYKHEEMPVGLPLAYKVKDGKVKIRVGIHDKLPMHTRVWEEMKIYGDKGGSSIRGEAEKQEKVCEGDVCHNNISELSLWSVSWVGNRPANPEATVTAVAAAKAAEPVKVTKQVTLDEIESMVEKIIERKNGKYCLYAKKDRKLLGCHDTKAGAVNQERAIQARRFSKMSEELDEILEVLKKKPCWAGYEMVGFKYEGGKKTPNCVPMNKADDPSTPAKPSERRRGSTRNPKGTASGERGGIKLSEANIKTLEGYRDKHNKKVGNAKGKKANMGALKAVFRRGAGAFSTSHRPSVRSRDQWALGRVKAFLKLLSSGRPSNPKYTTDYDLLPAGHPKSTKKEMKTVKVKPPKGHHWMAYKDGPVLMVGDYAPHEGAVEEFEFEVIEEHDESRLLKAEYQGRKVNLNKPFRLKGENKKFGVYAKNEKGNIVQVKFGDPKMDIKRDSPEKRRNFRARHNCDNPGPKYKARYWSCKMWSTSSVTDILGKIDKHIWDIAGMKKCSVKKGIEISKAPGRSQRGMRAFMTTCRRNALKLRNYEGLQSVRDPEAFCAELWRNPGKYTGRGPKMSPSKVRNQSGRALREAMARGGWTPKERLRRGRTPSWNKKS
tara:strand:+ start:1116 stop:3095 length:1980 start_codon:yes stop_codon:yes gene_type:complete